MVLNEQLQFVESTRGTHTRDSVTCLGDAMYVQKGIERTLATARWAVSCLDKLIHWNTFYIFAR